MKLQWFPTRSLLAFSVGALFFSAPKGYGQLDIGQQTDIGFTSLSARLGAAMPTGNGVSVTQAEAFEDPDGAGPLAATRYRPDAAVFPDKTFTAESAGDVGVSNHATTVGRFMYGSSSLAPDLGSTASGEEIRIFTAGDYLGTGFLRNGFDGFLPAIETSSIQNHSWVGNYPTVEANEEATRRLDFAIERDDFVAVLGVNNGRGTSVPSILAGAYNGITVGLSNGNHSRGGTTLEGAMRTRPDIVVPTYATSYAAGVVSGAAGLIIETARSSAPLNNAESSIVVKSLLMAGASRDEPEFVDNPGISKTWSNTSTQPLDIYYGAGELDLDRTFGILEAGEFEANDSGTVGATGWDLGTSNSTIPKTYFFDLDPENTDYQIAAALVWNRKIEATDNAGTPALDYEFNPVLANLTLKLYSASGFSVGTELSESASLVDNLQLITMNGLSAGRYAWQVSSADAATDYGFSWNVEGFTAVPEPRSALLLSVAVLGLFIRRK